MKLQLVLDDGTVVTLHQQIEVVLQNPNIMQAIVTRIRNEVRVPPSHRPSPTNSPPGP